MFIVAIAELKGDIDAALRPLSEALGTTAYELKLSLNAGLPAVVRVTADERQAAAANRAIADQGHFAVVCDKNEVIPSEAMNELRDFVLEPAGLLAQRGSKDCLPYADVHVLLRATHRTTRESSEQIKERQFRPVAAALSGGLVLTKTTKRTVTSMTANNEQVLYVFSRSRPPLILRERSAIYTGLGARRGPTSFENFNNTTELLRNRCPSAIYDERLRTSRPIRGLADGIEATDIYAHILSEYLPRRALR